MNNGSNILAVVGGLALTVGMVGIQAVHMVFPQHHAAPAVIHTTRVIVSTPVPAAKTQVPPTRIVPATHVAPKIAPTQIPTSVVQPTQQHAGNGSSTYTSQNPPFSLSYPTNWNVEPASNKYSVLSPDSNAGVGVYTEDSGPVDSTSLQSTLVNALPVFLQNYGGTETSNPQFQYVTVDGVAALASAFTVTKNGLSGMASVSAVYNNGVMYFVWGVVADQTSPAASQELAQVQAVMNSFHLQ